MILEFTGEITDPIHKYIPITDLEKKLIDTEFFQRLRKIRQLAGAHLVILVLSIPVSNIPSGLCIWQD